MSQLVKILSDPAWQGAGALVAVVALVLYVWFEKIHKQEPLEQESLKELIHPAPIRDLAATIPVSSQDHAVRYFAITDAESERRYYEELATHISRAEEQVIRLGRGFSQERRSPIFEQLIRAEEDALQRGASMVRIQAGGPVAPSWANGYARLLEQYSDQFRMVADLDSVSFNDITLIDPYSHDPVVHFLFETKDPGPLGPVGRPVIAIFIANARALASTLADQLTKHAAECYNFTPQDVRNLARIYTYFGWGVHMARRKMLGDVPDARLLGTAVLHGWQRDIRGMLAGPANRATIRRTGDFQQSFDGVAYELSWWGKARLDRLERRAYEEVRVEIEISGQKKPAFTYVPLPPASANTRLAPGSWIYLVVEGAVENNMEGLLRELRSAGVSMDDMRKDLI